MLRERVERLYYSFAFAIPKPWLWTPLLAAEFAALLVLLGYAGAVLLAFVAVESLVVRAAVGRFARLRRLGWMALAAATITLLYLLVAGSAVAVAAFGSIYGVYAGFLVGVGAAIPAIAGYIVAGVVVLAAGGLWPAVRGFLLSAASSLAVIGVALLRGGRWGLGMLAAHVRAWLEDDYELLEELTSCEEVESISTLLAYKLEDGRCVVVVVPGVHFGPFRRAGSSELPYRIREECVRRGLECIVLHGPLSHELDVSRRVDSERLAVILADAAARLCRSLGSSGCVEASESVRWVGSFRLVLLPGGTLLVLVDRPGRGIDDFYVEQTPLAVVDSHNEEVTVPPSSSELAALSEELRRESRSARLADSLEVGHEVVKLSEGEREEIGSCSDELHVLEIRGRRVLVVDSNNAEPGARSEVEEAGAYLVTTDDHVCAGVEPGKPVAKLRRAPLLERLAGRRVETRRVEACGVEFVAERVTVWGGCFEKLHELMVRGKPCIAAFILVLAAAVLLYPWIAAI